MNRIAAAITAIQPRIDALEADKRDALDASMDVEAFEHFAYQEEQARAHAAGKLTADEALIVYAALGEVGSDANGGWSKGTTLATKVIVTQLMSELVSARMGIRR